MFDLIVDADVGVSMSCIATSPSSLGFVLSRRTRGHDPDTPYRQASNFTHHSSSMKLIIIPPKRRQREKRDASVIDSNDLLHFRKQTRARHAVIMLLNKKKVHFAVLGGENCRDFFFLGGGVAELHA